VLTFFIAGLLYLLCLEHVDNLGAYSIPSGDRPSHPIWLRKLSSRGLSVSPQEAFQADMHPSDTDPSGLPP